MVSALATILSILVVVLFFYLGRHRKPLATSIAWLPLPLVAAAIAYDLGKELVYVLATCAVLIYGGVGIYIFRRSESSMSRVRGRQPRGRHGR